MLFEAFRGLGRGFGNISGLRVCGPRVTLKGLALLLKRPGA